MFWDVVLGTLAAQAPLVALVIAVLYFTLKREIDKVKGEIDKVKVEVKEDLTYLHERNEDLRMEVGKLRESFERLHKKVSELEARGSSLERTMYGFSETLVDFLTVKGVVTESERIVLRGLLATALPFAKTKYYTEEVRRRLAELLEKDDVTRDDIEEFDRISELIYKEYLETRRDDLIKYYAKLRLYIAILRGELRRKELERRAARAAPSSPPDRSDPEPPAELPDSRD